MDLSSEEHKEDTHKSIKLRNNKGVEKKKDLLKILLKEEVEHNFQIVIPIKNIIEILG